MSADIPPAEDLYRLIRTKWYFRSEQVILPEAFALRPVDADGPVEESELSLTRSSVRSAEQSRRDWVRKGNGPGVAAIKMATFDDEFESRIDEPHHVLMRPLVTDNRGQVLIDTQRRLAREARMVLLPIPARG